MCCPCFPRLLAPSHGPPHIKTSEQPLQMYLLHPRHTVWVLQSFFLGHIWHLFLLCAPFMRWTESQRAFPSCSRNTLRLFRLPGIQSGSWRRCRKRRRECCGRWPGASMRSSSCSCTFQSPCLGCPRNLCCGCSPGRWPVSCPGGRWRWPLRAVCSGAPRFCFTLVCRTPEWRWAWMRTWMRTPRACSSETCRPQWSSSPGAAARVRRRWSNCRTWRYDRAVPPLHQALPASPARSGRPPLGFPLYTCIFQA